MSSSWTAQAPLGVRWPLRISDPTQLSLRVGGDARYWPKCMASPHTRLSRSSNPISRRRWRGSRRQRYRVRFRLKWITRYARVLDALLALLYSLLIVAELGAMAPTSLRGSATRFVGSEKELSSISAAVLCTCTAYYQDDLFVLSVFALATLPQRQWFILTVQYPGWSTIAGRLVSPSRRRTMTNRRRIGSFNNSMSSYPTPY